MYLLGVIICKTAAGAENNKVKVKQTQRIMTPCYTARTVFILKIISPLFKCIKIHSI